MVYGLHRPTLDIRAMKGCKCVHCEWNREKRGRSFTEFYRDSVNDNSHYATRNKNCELLTQNTAFLHSGLANSFLEFNPNTNRVDSEWAPDQIADHLDNLQASEERENKRGHAAPLGLSFPPKLEKDEHVGHHWTKVYEHKVQSGWRPKGLAQHAPPCNGGQRQSVRLSSKARRRLLERAFALGRHVEDAVFVTLTYKMSVCQSEAKYHMERFIKRVRYWAGHEDWLWVAELQRRGVIHFHLLMGGRLDKDWIQTTWRSITEQEVYTHVGGIGKAYAYLAKYVGKSDGKEIYEPIVGRRWAASRRVTQWSKPLWEQCKDSTFEQWDEETKEYKEHFEWMRSTPPGVILRGVDNLDLHDRYSKKT